jgi:hypothetical protein
MPEPNHTTEKLADFLENPPYQRRLVIFYDVLGWRNHIKAAGSNSEKIGNLRRLILRSHRSLRLRYPQFNMKISTFSDNIVITQAINDTTPRLLTLMAFQQIAVAAALPGAKCSIAGASPFRARSAMWSSTARRVSATCWSKSPLGICHPSTDRFTLRGDTAGCSVDIEVLWPKWPLLTD